MKSLSVDEPGSVGKDGKSHCPPDSLRWTIYRAAAEFGVPNETLTKKLRALCEASGDGKYSTVQIAEAIFGEDPRKEKDRETAENFRLRNAELRREMIPLELVSGLWANALMTFAAMVKASGLPKSKCNELLAELEGVEMPAKW